MKYLIFSDESGKWNEGNYYVRSWIRITPDNYTLLRKEVVFAKHETGVKELKWERFRKNFDKFEGIFNVDFTIFITLSKPAHFQNKNYNIINELNNISTSTGGEKLTNKVKTKIINSAKHQLFLNYYEKIHIENSKKALVGPEKSENYKYLVDTPQYLDKEWEDVAKECGIQQVNIIKVSANNPGIEVADMVSGCIMSLLKMENPAKNIYEQFLKSKMLNMGSKDYPNPNFIFYKDFTNEEKREVNIFR